MEPPHIEATRRVMEGMALLTAGNFAQALQTLRAVKRDCDLGGFELLVEGGMGRCLNGLKDFRGALPHQQRLVELTGIHSGKQSLEYAMTLRQLGTSHRGLGQWTQALRAYKEAKGILEDNKMTSIEEYAHLLHALGRLEAEQERYEQAMEWYRKSETVARRNFKTFYGLLIGDMARCLQFMGDYNAAIERYQEAVSLKFEQFGPTHPEYATSLYNLGTAFFEMKRFEEAIPRLEEAVAIQKQVFGYNHALTLTSTEALQRARNGLKDPANARVNEFVSDQRICGYCKKIGTKLDKCGDCSRMHYCSIECAQADWERHRPQCEEWQREFGCAGCQATNNVQLKYCSGCLRVKYCSVDCQREHWDAHKTDCRKWKAESKKK